MPRTKITPKVPYFTPLQSPPAGAAFVTENGKQVPKLFQPLKLRGLTLPNRIFLSPLCKTRVYLIHTNKSDRFP